MTFFRFVQGWLAALLGIRGASFTTGCDAAVTLHADSLRFFQIRIIVLPITISRQRRCPFNILPVLLVRILFLNSEKKQDKYEERVPYTAR
jgi:hypothetical protein